MKLVLWAAEEAATTAAEAAAETAAETATETVASTVVEKTIDMVKSNPLLAAGIGLGAVALGWGGYALYKKLRS